MISDKEKLKKYISEYPEQVFVNQNNLFSLDSYELEEIGYAATIILDKRIDDTSGSYTIHEESMSQCIGMTRTYYESRLDLNPSVEIENLVGQIFDIAKSEEDEFTALAVFMPFIRQVEHNSILLESLHENIFEEPYFQVLLEGPKQNRFWISKYNRR
jgi:hypothetical protein